MRTVIRKVFLAWDFEREEEWLNEMAKKGLALVSVGWCRYEFEPCEAGEYIVRLQLLEKERDAEESRDYMALLEEMGAEHVGSWMRWVYLRRKASEGPFELFSDSASRIRQLSAIIALISVIGGLNLIVGGYNTVLWSAHGMGLNLMGIVNLLLGIFCFAGVFRLRRKQEQLRRDQNLFE